MYYIQTKPRKNSRKYSKTIAKFMNIEEVPQYIKDNNLSVLPKPYFFTHIPLSDGSIITQTVGVYETVCSPMKLAERLY